MWKWNPEAPKSNTAGQQILTQCPETRQDTVTLATAHANGRIYDDDTRSDTATVPG